MTRRGRNLTATNDERGTGLIEFAMVGLLFFTIIFGIISFGVLLTFKQNMTQAASESARASLAVVDKDTTSSVDERKDVAVLSMESALTEFDRECGTNVKCLVVIHECNTDPDFTVALTQARPDLVKPNASEPTDPCLTSRVEYENRGDDRILPPFPIIAKFEPDGFSSQTTIRLAPVYGSTTTTVGP